MRRKGGADAPPSPPAAGPASRTSEPLPGSWSGRQEFGDLFVPDTAAGPARGGSLEEKVDYFREKLKRSETQAARFRDAWQVRDREIDTLELVLSKERERVNAETARAQELQQKSTTLERFVEQKKGEFENYHQKVAATLAQKEEAERLLKERVGAAEADRQRQVQGKDAEIQGLEGQLTALQDELKEAFRLRTEDQQAASTQMQAQETKIGQLDERVADLARELEAARQELLDTRASLERDIGLRTEAIDKLKSSLDSQRQAIVERDEHVDRLTTQLHEAEEQYATASATWTETQAEHEASREQLEREVAMRNEAIDKLKAAIQSQREAMGERDTQIDNLSQENAKLHQDLTDTQSTLQNTEIQTTDQIAEFTRGIELRDEAIGKLKQSIEAQRGRLQENEESLQATQVQLQELQEAADTERQRSGDILERTRKALEVAQRLLS